MESNSFCLFFIFISVLINCQGGGEKAEEVINGEVNAPEATSEIATSHADTVNGNQQDEAGYISKFYHCDPNVESTL